MNGTYVHLAAKLPLSCKLDEASETDLQLRMEEADKMAASTEACSPRVKAHIHFPRLPLVAITYYILLLFRYEFHRQCSFSIHLET